MPRIMSCARHLLAILWLSASLTAVPSHAAAAPGRDAHDPLAAKAELWKDGPPRGLEVTPPARSPDPAPAGSPATAWSEPTPSAGRSSPADYMPKWTRIAFQSYRDGNYEIYTAHVNGTESVRVTNNPAADVTPRVHGRESRMVFVSRRDGNWELYASALDGSDLRRLTNTPAAEAEPAWSPDGSQIAFSSDRSGTWDIYVMNADGSNVRQLTAGKSDGAPAWSPAGDKIAFVRYDAPISGFVYTMRVDGGNITRISDELVFPSRTTWSPDGRWIALDCDVNLNGWTDLLIMDLTNGRQNVRYSPGAGVDLWMGGWSPDSSSLIFTSTQWVDVGDGYALAGGSLATSSPTSFWISPQPVSSGYDFSPDWFKTDFAPPATGIRPLPEFSPADAFAVEWGGFDSGTGIAQFEVEVRVDGGPWQTWQSWTTWTQGQYAGEPGSTIEFRSRGIDYAQNMEAWPATADARTRLYAARLGGAVYDVRDRPVPGADIITSLVSLEPVRTNETGQYWAHLTSTGQVTVHAAHPGYGEEPGITRTAQPDPISALWPPPASWLPPADNVVIGGGFEEQGGGGAWQFSGDTLPSVTTAMRHRGATSISLGRPLGFGPAEPLPYTEYVQLVVADDHVSLVALGGQPASSGEGTELYLSRNTFGGWSEPVTILTGARSFVNLATAGDDAGGLHIIFMYLDDWPRIHHCYVPPTGATCTPAAVPGWQGDSFVVMAPRPGGEVHVAASNAYAHRTEAGVWDVVETPAELGDMLAPALAVDEQGLPHLAWAEPVPYQGMQTFHSVRQADGKWTTREQVVAGSESWTNPLLAFAPDGTLYLSWHDWNAEAPKRGSYVTYKKPGGGWAPSVHVAPETNRRLFVANAEGPQLLVRSDDDTRISLLTPDGDGDWNADLTMEVNGLWVEGAVDGANGLHVLLHDRREWPPTISYRAPDAATTASVSALSQTVTIPADSHRPTLSFFVRSNPTATGRLAVSVEADGAKQPLELQVSGQGWQHAWADMTAWAGQTVTLWFEVKQPARMPNGQVWLDDIVLGSWLTPVIDSVKVSGDTLTIEGSNFVGTPQVWLDDQALTVQMIGDGRLTASLMTVQALGLRSVWVTNPDGQQAAKRVWLGRNVFLSEIAR